MEISKGRYTTNNLALAAALALWHPLTEVEKGSSKRVTFVFKRSFALDTDIERFYNRELSVEPNEYYQQLQVLKARIYE